MLRVILSTIAALAYLTGCGPKKEVVNKTVERRIEIPVEVPPPITAPPEPDFLRFERFEQEIIDDLNSLPEQERLFTRYVWNPQFNEGPNDIRDARIRDGVSFGINSLSTERDMQAATGIGSTDNIYRIDLRDYNLSRQKWIFIEERLDTPVVADTIRGQTIRGLTQTAVPWVYADDFYNTSFTSPGLYNYLINQPGVNSLAEFLDGIGTIPQIEFDDLEAILGGFTQSTISLQKNRLIQRLDTIDGSVYSTFDTDVNGDNLFENPFPVEARSEKTFRHDAQEHLYTLPNGLLGYRLNAANNGAGGAVENEAPITVVIDNRASIKGLSPVINYLSCSRCHFPGILAFQDQIGPHIISSTGFNANDKLRSENFFRGDRMASVIRQDNARLRQAASLINISRLDLDPLNEYITDPFRLEQDLQQISARYFLRPGEFGERLAASPTASVQVGNLLNRGAVGLEQLKVSHFVIIEDLNLFRDRDQINVGLGLASIQIAPPAKRYVGYLPGQDTPVALNSRVVEFYKSRKIDTGGQYEVVE